MAMATALLLKGNPSSLLRWKNHMFLSVGSPRPAPRLMPVNLGLIKSTDQFSKSLAEMRIRCFKMNHVTKLMAMATTLLPKGNPSLLLRWKNHMVLSVGSPRPAPRLMPVNLKPTDQFSKSFAEMRIRSFKMNVTKSLNNIEQTSLNHHPSGGKPITRALRNSAVIVAFLGFLSMTIMMICSSSSSDGSYSWECRDEEDGVRFCLILVIVILVLVLVFICYEEQRSSSSSPPQSSVLKPQV